MLYLKKKQEMIVSVLMEKIIDLIGYLTIDFFLDISYNNYLFILYLYLL